MKRNALILAIETLILFGAAGPLPPATAQQMPDEYQKVLDYLGKKGDYKADVLKINIARNDLHVTVHGVSTPTPFGFGGWLGITKGQGGTEVMMGDLVLLQDEVNPVMSALLENGLDVTALHNHFFWEEPRLFYMHVGGHGKAMDLAHKVKPALDLIGHGAPAGAANPASATSTASAEKGAAEGKLDTAKITRIVGHEGEQLGAVYKITVGRDDLKLTEMGANINARMGLNTWAAFVGNDQNAAIAGDVAMLQSEVAPVLKALRKNGLDVVAIHHHMIGVRPMIIFLHYWGEGPAEKLAAGFRAALDVLGKGEGADKTGQ